MLVGDARATAVDWVQRFAAQTPDFRGAFFTGSTTAMPLDVELPASSDVDVAVVLDAPWAPPKLGKFSFADALLEVTHLPWDQLQSIDDVARTYYLAPSFSSDQIIADPTGHLGLLRDHIAPSFAEPASVDRRCANAIDKLTRGLQAIDSAAPWHEQVTWWMFPTSITTHVVLVDALRNPTVRLRYLAARDVLHEQGRLDIYGELLELLGCADIESGLVQHHLAELAKTFDETAAIAATAFFFSADITPLARPVAIDGSQNLIASGDHREAVFWIVATYARCQQILAADASASTFRASNNRFKAAVTDLLGLHDTNDLFTRRRAVAGLLPRLRSAKGLSQIGE